MSSSGELEPHEPGRLDGSADPPAEPEHFTDPNEYVAVIQSALDQYGEAFLAWLMLDGVDQTKRSIVEDFTGCYAGWFPTRRAFVETQLEGLGWQDELDRFQVEHGIRPRALRFDWECIWEHCLEIYDVEERLPGVHAFLK